MQGELLVHRFVLPLQIKWLRVTLIFYPGYESCSSLTKLHR